MSTQTPDVLDGAEILANLKGKQSQPENPVQLVLLREADADGFQDAVTKN